MGIEVVAPPIGKRSAPGSEKRKIQPMPSERSGFIAEHKEDAMKCMNLYEDQNLTVALFCFPAGAIIPIHDHPGMTVFTKLICGVMHVREFDVVSPLTGLAKLTCDKVVEASQTGVRVIGPNHSNLHTFQAVTNCCVFDILTPP